MPYARSQGGRDRSWSKLRSRPAESIALDKGGLCGERGQFTKPAAALRYKRVRRGRLLWAWTKGHAPAERREAHLRHLPGLGTGGPYINALVQAAGCSRAATWAWTCRTVVNAALNAAPFCIGFRFIFKRCRPVPAVLHHDHRCAGWLPYYASTDDTLPNSIFGGIINGTVMAIRPRAHAASGGSFPL